MNASSIMTLGVMLMCAVTAGILVALHDWIGGGIVLLTAILLAWVFQELE